MSSAEERAIARINVEKYFELEKNIEKNIAIVENYFDILLNLGVSDDEIKNDFSDGDLIDEIIEIYFNKRRKK